MKKIIFRRLRGNREPMIRIELISHCSFRITVHDGTVIITDPWLNSINPLRSVPLPYNWRTIPRCNVVLVSHNHIDHLDRSGMKMTRKLAALFIGPPSAVARARRQGLSNCISLEPGETFRVEDVRITGLPTAHYLTPDGLGYIIDHDNTTLYFSGDTNLTPELRDQLVRRKPDIMILQIRPSFYFGRKEGMNADEAASLVRDVLPSVAIPMHYHERTKTENPQKFIDALADVPVRAVVLQPGVPMDFMENPPDSSG